MVTLRSRFPQAILPKEIHHHSPNTIREASTEIRSPMLYNSSVVSTSLGSIPANLNVCELGFISQSNHPHFIVMAKPTDCRVAHTPPFSYKNVLHNEIVMNSVGTSA